MTLRAELLAWERAFDILPESSASCLLPWAKAAYARLGPRRRTRPTEEGDPEGFSGLTRRGPFTRTLISEWAVAEVEELEFLRRVAEHELTFVDLERASTDDPKATLVLFDTGPDQLGAPRLAHLAIAFAFAHRCASVGAELFFGALAHPGTLHRGVDVSSLAGLMDQRSSRSATEAAQAEWEAWIERERLPIEDRWVVGGRDVLRFTRKRRYAACAITEPPEDADHLVFEVLRGGHTPAHTPLRLELPPTERCVQLLRDPFTEPPPPEGAAGPREAKFMHRGPIYFSSDGNRLMTRDPRGIVVANHIPMSPHAKPGRARSVPLENDESLVAAGMMGRRLVMLTFTASGARLRRVLDGATDAPVHGPPQLLRALFDASRRASGFWPLWAADASQNDRRCLRMVTDEGGIYDFEWLHTAGHRAKGTSAEVIERSVGKPARSPSWAEFVLHRGELDPKSGAIVPPTPSKWYPPPWAKALPWHRLDDASVGVWEVGKPLSMQVFALRRPEDASAAPTCHGAVRYAGEIRVVLLSADRRVLSLGRANGETMRLRTFTKRITSVDLSDDLMRIAVLTETGELWAYSFEFSRVVFHERPRRQGAAG